MRDQSLLHNLPGRYKRCEEVMPTIPLTRRVIAEAVGTYALVTAGCGAIMVQSLTGTITHVGVALTFGLIVMVIIMATGHLSGAHLNPAVTIAFAFTRHFRWGDVPPYVIAQCGGAIAGAATLRLLFGPIAHLGATLPTGGTWQAVGLEILLTAVLMFVIISVATDSRAAGHLAAIAIGATVALDALWGGPISGASMNPARSFGPALIAGLWQDQWIYWLAPIVGACLGAFVYEIIRMPAQQTAADAVAAPSGRVARAQR